MAPSSFDLMRMLHACNIGMQDIQQLLQLHQYIIIGL